MSCSKIRIRHNLSVPDLKEYYKQLWEVGDGSVTSSLVCGHHTDMVFVGRTPDINEESSIPEYEKSSLWHRRHILQRACIRHGRSGQQKP